MSDQSSPPAKPKPGSLRDRIAAFEKSATSAAPAPAPAPRPKPAGFQSWKPKVPSPPSSPVASSTTEHVSPSASGVKPGGMSASDAKESITKAGSLKDRMAALQGKGAFGAPPAVAPKPAVEKPKWKPPPVVQAPVDDDDHTDGASTTDIAAAVERNISPPTSVQSLDNIGSPKSLGEGDESATDPPSVAEGDNGEGTAPVDPEEEERQRRAAIAARMARLGGARVGMVPPVFGKKPPVRRPTQDSVDSKREVSSPEIAKSLEPPTDEVLASSPPSEAPIQERSQSDLPKSPDFVPMRKNSESTSILSSESNDSHSIRNPTSMPVPAAPRRAGPPRKKPVKTVPPPPDEAIEVPSGIVSTEKGESHSQTELPPINPNELHEHNTSDLDPDVTKEPPQAPSELSAEVDDAKHPNPVVEDEALVSESEEQILGSSPRPTSLKSPATKVSSHLESSGGISSPSSQVIPQEEPTQEDEESEEGSEYADESEEILSAPSAPSHHVDHTTAVEYYGTEDSPAVAHIEEHTEETEEEARKNRVAERIAKMGGINPFGPPPVSSSSQSPPSPPVASAATDVSSSLSPPAVPEEHPARKEYAVESDVEAEPFDEGEGEDHFSDDESNEEHEKPKAPMSPSFEAQREQGYYAGSRPSHSVPPSENRPPAHVVQQSEDLADVDEEARSDEEFVDETSASAVASHSPKIPLRTSSQHSNQASPPARPAQPPRRIIPLVPETSADEEEPEESADEEADERLAQSHLFIPPPGTQKYLGATPLSRRHLQDEEDGDGSENDAPALPYLQRKSTEVPLPQRPPYDLDEDSDHDGPALPVPPGHNSGPPPRLVPPPAPPSQVEEPVHHARHIGRPLPSNPGQPLPTLPPLITPSLSVSGSEEVLDDEEGDPIDPSFHSPSRQPSSSNLFSLAQGHSGPSTPSAPPPSHHTVPSPPPQAPPRRSLAASPPSQPSSPTPLDALEDNGEDVAQDPEQLRRKTIAERMAKLGGIKFGAAPPSIPASRPPLPPPEEEEDQDASEAVLEDAPTEPSEEEEERARKERIAAKLANMGGMRIGMMPMGMGTLPPQKSHVLREEEVPRSLPSPAPTPSRTVPPPRPPPPPSHSRPVPQAIETDSDYGSAAASDDGVKVEAEESELEEVTHDDVKEEEDMPPPPVPSRVARAPSKSRSSGDTMTSPTVSSFRPPVPTSMPARRSSVQTTRSASTSSAAELAITSPPRKRSSFIPAPQSEYVMVEEPESLDTPPPPPPPGRRPSSRLPPARTTPPVPQPPPLNTMQNTDASDSISSQWELPSIPSSQLDFGETADLSLSWTDASEAGSSTGPSQAPPLPSKRRATMSSDVHLSADDLMMVWGRVGVQVCEVATTMFEKSKKSVIGDGTYDGFVQAVMAAVPNAASAQNGASSYGYLVYLQNGASVQKRASDIMPGDIVEIQDGKFKGHKGLQTYHQNVGAAPQPLVGVVGEFEAKKTKIRVFHANQHVGQQAVESVSYRLEDLKSGVVKVYRALEA